MGTLFNQPVREYYAIDKRKTLNFIEQVKEISKETGLTEELVIKAFEIKEMERKNDLFVVNGNIHDEQMAGIGELIKELNGVIQSFRPKPMRESDFD